MKIAINKKWPAGTHTEDRTAAFPLPDKLKLGSHKEKIPNNYTHTYIETNTIKQVVVVISNIRNIHHITSCKRLRQKRLNLCAHSIHWLPQPARNTVNNMQINIIDKYTHTQTHRSRAIIQSQLVVHRISDTCIYLQSIFRYAIHCHCPLDLNSPRKCLQVSRVQYSKLDWRFCSPALRPVRAKANTHTQFYYIMIYVVTVKYNLERRIFMVFVISRTF